MAYSALGMGLLRLAGMAGKAAPAVKGIVSKVGIPAAVGTVVGGVRGGQQGGLGGVVPGALGGGLTGGGLGMIPGVGGLNPYLQSGLGGLGGLYGPASMGVTQQVGQGALNTGLGTGAMALTRSGGVGPQGDSLGNLPPGTTARMKGPDGGYWYQLDPSGVPMGNRLGRQLDAITDASNINTLGNAIYGQTERAAKSELARQSAATQLASNIQQARQMSLNSQEAGLRMGIDAGQNMASALANRQNFRYF